LQGCVLLIHGFINLDFSDGTPESFQGGKQGRAIHAAEGQRSERAIFQGRGELGSRGRDRLSKCGQILSPAFGDACADPRFGLTALPLREPRARSPAAAGQRRPETCKAPAGPTFFAPANKSHG
jgi:hypothetical protein